MYILRTLREYLYNNDHHEQSIKLDLEIDLLHSNLQSAMKDRLSQEIKRTTEE